MCNIVGTVLDPAGNPYANATVIASFVNQNTTPGSGPSLLNGSPGGVFNPVVPAETDSAGVLSMVLPGNDIIQPSPSQWKFTVLSSTTPPVSFSALISITGNTQDVTAALQAAAASLVEPTHVASLALVEGTAPVPVVGQALIYTTAASHRVLTANNGAAGVQLVQAGIDINTSDQVTATHLSLPLPVSQGGTGVTTATGVITSNAVLSESPTLVTPNIGIATAQSILGLTGQVTPSLPGGINLGTPALPFSGIYVGSAASNNIRITGTATAPRTFTLPDADSNPVVPSSAPAHQFATGISSAGAITFTQPSAADLTNGTTGSGSLVLAISPTLTTPNIGAATGTSLTLSGAILPRSMDNIQIASQFAGADCGAKINAADLALGATPGEIWVSQSAGTTISTAVSLSANHVLRFTQGGTYTCSAAITMGQGSVILGPGSGGNLTPVVLQAAAASNLPSLVNTGNQSSILDITLDGNKANNPTGGVGIKINQTQQVRITRVLVQNFKSHGFLISSTLAGDEASVPVLDNCLVFSNDGDGLRASNTTDGFMSKVQFEQNGLGGNAVSAVTVNTSGTTVTWVSGPKWSTDSSLVGTFIRINGSYFLVATIPSTTSLTVTVSPGTLSGVALNWGNGAEMSDSPGWRFEQCDFGGNANNGLLLYGSDAGRGSGQQIVTGNQFGGQRAIDIEELGFGTAAYVAVNNTYTANMFLGSSIRTPNTYSAIRLQDFQDDVIIGNVFRPANTKYGVEFTESAASRSQRSILAGNSFITGFGTGAYATNTANFGAAIGIFANAEGTTTSSTFGSGAGSIKFQGGILNSGTGLQHVRQAAGCTTAAAVNARCTATVTWPATWNDTNYTVTCNIGSVTNPVFVEWTGNFTTTSLQVIIGNPADSAAAATGTIHCIGIHD